jgi:RNA recognition motif-containing protein
MKIMVRNLSKNTKKEQIIELLRQYGNLGSFNLVMDRGTGKSKGFGFAEMPDKKEAQKAIKALNGKVIDGEKIRVKTVATSRKKGKR